MSIASKKLPSNNDTKPKHVLKKYGDRLAVLKQAMLYSHKDDMSHAVTAYMRYLQALAQYFEVEEKDLKPDLFEKDNNLAEILLISQVYWDLAKAYDRSTKFQKESERCLRQFVKFSLGYKFQFINSEMIRKYVKKRYAYNQKAFEDAYKQLKINSKKCYIATHCFGENHSITNNYRKVKPLLMKHQLGSVFIDQYYSKSPLLISFLQKHPYIDYVFTKLITKPLLTVFSNFLTRFIIK